MKQVDRATEREVLAARLARAADIRKVLRVFATFCHRQLGGDASVVMVRDRRDGTWSVATRIGEGLSESDADLLERREARDPAQRLHRIARPLRPHGRLFGGTVLLRVRRVFTLGDAGRLGRLSRTVSAELERRDRTALESAIHRLHRKLAHGVASHDVLYHVLDEAVRLTAANHSAAALVHDGGHRWRVLAEKLVGARSSRIGKIVSIDPDLEDQAPRLTALRESRTGRRCFLIVTASGGDPFDDWDRRIVERLCEPTAAAIDRVFNSQF